MGQIGHFGDIQFRVKSRKNGIPEILSFDDATWQSSISLEEHKIHKKKGFLEFTERELDTFSMNIYVSAVNHVHPLYYVKKFRQYNLRAKAYPLVIGGKRIGSYYFAITDVSNDFEQFYRNGKLIAVRIQVTFKEYRFLRKHSKKKKVIKGSSKKGSSSAKKKASTVASSSGKSAAAKKGYEAYTVKKGDTLWDLARKYYGSGRKYTKIYNANKTASSGFHRIADPNKIQVGWTIKIPK